MPAEWLAPLQFRQSRVLRKCADANDCIMTPIIALRAVPPRDPRSDQRAVESPGTLLQPCEQRSGIYHDRQCLDESDGRMALLCSAKPDDRVTGHQAVGIQYNHMIIAGTEPQDPVLDIAGFSRGVFRAVTIEHPAGSDIAAKLQETFLFGDPDRRVRGVAQNEPVKLRSAAGFLDRLTYGPQPRHDSIGVFVVGRQQHCILAGYRRKRGLGVDAKWIAHPE